MALVDLQRRVRDAVVRGEAESIAPLLAGGLLPARRFDIHRRHYEESLTAAVVGRFPATAWLLGPAQLEASARAFVHAHPPTAPCIAEYGTAFPGFLGTWPATAHLSYLPAFADLDWHLGRLAVSVDLAAVAAGELSRFGPDDLADSVVAFQPGTHYADAPWNIDALMGIALADTAPDSWTLRNDDVRLEVRGSRGAFQFRRLTAADYRFRTALAAGLRLGHAAALAVELEPAADPGVRLLTLFQDGLVISVGRSGAGDRP